MERLAGSYNSEKGKIMNPMKNMRAGDVTDAYATFIHEIQHVHLNYFTTIGQVIEILQKERMCTPDTDREHCQKIQRLTEILEHRMSELQEIYANSQELLWVEEYQGMEEARRVYRRKSELYQKYSRKFQEVVKTCESLQKKREMIHAMCVRVASPSMTADQFTELLMDEERLEKYFANEGNISKKLEKLLEDLRHLSGNTVKQAVTSEIPEIQITELITWMIRKKICVYAAAFLKFSQSIASLMTEDERRELAEKQYQDSLIKKMRGFDFSAAEEYMKILPSTWKEEYFSVTRCSQRLLYPENNWLLIGWDGKKNYVGQEVSEEELYEALKTAKAVALPFDEFDCVGGQPKYFQRKGFPLFVLLEEYRQCDGWIGEILEEDLYFVDLYPEEVQNFYTVLFFRRRKEPDVIYVFPTLKYLAEMLIKKWKLQNLILTSQNQDSLKLFACFEDEIHMMEAITWLMSFVSGTGWNGKHIQQAASLLCAGFVRSLLESALQIRIRGYWKYRSCLPTENTVSDGFYTYMKFQGRENTGSICAQEHGEKSYPVLFGSPAAAKAYALRVPQDKNYRLVAVDDCYWEVLKEYLKRNTGKWCLYLNEEKGVLFSVEAYEQVRQLVRKHSACRHPAHCKTI